MAADVLCRHTHYTAPTDINPDMALILQLYPGPPSVFADYSLSQKQAGLNERLKQAIKDANVEQVLKSLMEGANPHAPFDCDSELSDLYLNSDRGEDGWLPPIPNKVIITPHDH